MQLGVGGAAADAELDRLKESCEAAILARANLIGCFAPLVAEFCIRRCALSSTPLPHPQHSPLLVCWRF